MPAVLCVAAESGPKEEMRGTSALDSAESGPREEMRSTSALDSAGCCPKGDRTQCIRKIEYNVPPRR